jgi:hypothetical protein
VLADVQPGTADREIQLKYRGASRRCDVCRAERDVQAGKITAGQALERAGWDRASGYERGLLLEIFGLEAPPANLAVREPQPEPAPFVPRPAPGEPSPEQLAEMDALVDGLVAQWKAGPQPEPEHQPEPEPELEASA